MNIKFYHFSKTAVLFLALVLLINGCKKDDPIGSGPYGLTKAYSYQLAVDWNELFLDLERYTAGYRPPVSARALGYVNLAAYESVLPGMTADYNSMETVFAGLVLPKAEEGEAYHWGACYTAAYVKSLELFFPTAPAEHLFKIYELQNEYYAEFKQEVPHDVFTRSAEFGRSIANAVYDWSTTDQVGHEAYLKNNDVAYLPPAGTGRWQPTFPDYSPALLPNWGAVRTFAATSEDVVPAPLPYSEDPSSPLYQQALATRTLVDEIKKGKFAEDAWIADFWSDDCPILTFTPAGRWIAVLNQVIEKEKPGLDLAAEAFARVGMALCDAGVRCWHEKYRFNVERPIDYIRRVQGHSDWNTIMCPDGSGRYYTPNFPAYPSGHATFGGVAAEVMTDLFGDNYAMMDRCHEGRTEFNGTPRAFTSFYEMAEENGYSRIPIGVHFQMDSDAGVQLGYGIGKKINNLPWRK